VGEDSRSNWRRATTHRLMLAQVADLIAIGIALGPATAERVYLALHEEPRTARGDRIDWTTILAEIHRQAPQTRGRGKDS
jgi:hypothetical protein